MIFQLLLLTIAQFLLGVGVLAKLAPMLKRFQAIPLAVLIGTFGSTLAVYLIGLFGLTVNWVTFLGLFAVLLAACLFPFQSSMAFVKRLFVFKGFDFKAYELVTIGVIVYIFFISAWKAYYLPVVSFDSVNGIDLYAKTAIREGTLVPFIFDGVYIKSLSTQAYYAPYTAFMQIVYRLAGTEFGQVWLSVVFMCFIVYIYHALKEYVHPALAGLITVFVATVPEFYAYTFILQTDFSNAVFTLIGVVFLAQFWDSGAFERLNLSALFFAMACWTRSETVFFLPWFGLFVFVKLWKTNKLEAFKRTALFGVLAGSTFFLWNIVFYRFYFPGAPKTGNLIRMGDYSGDSIGSVIAEINEKVLFADHYWGYVLYLVILCVVLDLLVFRKLGGKFYLLSLLIFYVTFILLELHFVHFNIENTFRRGFFKFVVVGYFYLSQSLVLKKVSDAITKFELK